MSIKLSSLANSKGSRSLAGHHVHVIDDKAGGTVIWREDGMETTKADVRLVDIIEDRLVDSQAAREGVDELGTE